MSCMYCGDEHSSMACEGPMNPPSLPEPRMTVDFGARPAATPEPAPLPNDKPALWDLVIEDVKEMSAHLTLIPIIADMRARDVFGRAKYGTPLQAGNGRDAIVDAYQEALDLCVYLKQVLVEKYDGRVWAHYRDALNLVVGLAGLIAERGR